MQFDWSVSNQDQIIPHGKFKFTVAFYKTITKWFSVEDSVIHAHGMLFATFGKRKKTLASG